MRAVDPSSVSLVDIEHPIMAIGERHQVIEWCTVALHGVEALDGEPHPTAATKCAPFKNLCLKCSDLVVQGAGNFRPACASAFMRACVSEGIEHYEISILGESREHRVVCDIAAAEVKATLRMKECCRSGLEFLVFRSIPSK